MQARRDEYDTLSEEIAASYLQGGQVDYTSFSTSFMTQRRRYYELGLRLDLVTASATGAGGTAGVGAVGQGSNSSNGGGGLSSQPPSYYK